MGSRKVSSSAVLVIGLALAFTATACKKRAPGESTSSNRDGGSGYGNSSTASLSGVLPEGGSILNKDGSRSPAAENAVDARGVPIVGAKKADGTVVTPADVVQAEADLKAKAEPVPVEPKCFTLSYERKVKNITEDAASQQKNMIVLKHDQFDFASLCVRVNGTPVRFKHDKNKPNEVLLSAAVAPKAKISARYCIEKTSCSESKCTIPKDEFMEAIGGVEQAAADDSAEEPSGNSKAKKSKANRKIANYGDWTGGAGARDVTTSLDADLKRELADMDDPSIKFTLNRDWDVSNEHSSCLKPVGSQAKH